jgi:hypothetical protein
MTVAGLAASLGLALLYFHLSGMRGAPDAAFLTRALPVLVAAPYALLLAASLRGPRSRTLALAGGLGAVAALFLAPFAVVLVLFAGFAGSQRELLAIGVLALFALVQPVLAVSAARAHRRLADTEKRPGAWATGIALPLAYALCIAAGLRIAARPADGAAHADAAASAALDEVVRCARAFAAARPERGFPRRLEDLGPGGSGCLAEAVAHGAAGEHAVRYVPGVPDAEGRIALFDVCVLPAPGARPFLHGFVADESGVPHAGSDGALASADGAPPARCADVWPEGLARVKHCLVNEAASRGGYPVDASVAVALAPCVAVRGAVAEGGVGLALGERRFVYRAVPQGADGVVRGFTLATREGEEALLLDETGALHAATGRDATRGDPTRAEREDRACLDAGDAAACRAAGQRYESGRGAAASPARAADFYERGCALADPDACRSAGHLLTFHEELSSDLARRVRVLTRACELGLEDGCAGLVEAKRAAGEPGNATPPGGG